MADPQELAQAQRIRDGLAAADASARHDVVALISVIYDDIAESPLVRYDEQLRQHVLQMASELAALSDEQATRIFDLVKDLL